MRAKIALALATISAIAALTPVVNASPLTRDVARILNHDGLYRKPIIARRIVAQPIAVRTLTQAAVVTDACGNTAAVSVADTCGQSKIISRARLLNADVNGTPMILSQPVVIAPATTGVALLAPGPRDLDERRDALEKRINEATALGQLDASSACDLKAAMSEVKKAELDWLACGPLTNEMARRLYRSMDKVDSDLHWYANTNAVSLVRLRLTPTALEF